MAERCAKTSSPVYRWMKPNPLAPLNHFTVPFSLTNCSFRLCADGIPSSGRHEVPAFNLWMEPDRVRCTLPLNKNAAASIAFAEPALAGPPATALLPTQLDCCS